MQRGVPLRGLGMDDLVSEALQGGKGKRDQRRHDNDRGCPPWSQECGDMTEKGLQNGLTGLGGQIRGDQVE